VNERQPDVDLRAAVIVPARPGPLVRSYDLVRGRDEIDELLDDVFGEPDDRARSNRRPGGDERSSSPGRWSASNDITGGSALGPAIAVGRRARLASSTLVTSTRASARHLVAQTRQALRAAHRRSSGTNLHQGLVDAARPQVDETSDVMCAPGRKATT